MDSKKKKEKTKDKPDNGGYGYKHKVEEAARFVSLSFNASPNCKEHVNQGMGQSLLRWHLQLSETNYS